MEVGLDGLFGEKFARRREDTPAAPKNAVMVQPAMGDCVWVAAEPLGFLMLGQEVSLNSKVGVQVGDRHAMARRMGDWVKVTEVGEYAGKRRSLFVQAVEMWSRRATHLFLRRNR
ncbi:unnamed protein product [Durusdinium trenchii]|uniref:Uncharacterized protein n=1 Tax=Durusdinium trenchii TaxID=1381693 RepID=A0ABP0KFP6_9DINO